ncbi:hypothetical protein Ahy_B06g085030 [Arachis hypogaea]|uniref:Uncharacterized protein n=1 Tax=Arachis hypogaea TaxID=3818 RepID=A0A444YTA1_ARAHY|nr:hypothetical protein Ahy_B06g085030 [Arachis hypogaea]
MCNDFLKKKSLDEYVVACLQQLSSCLLTSFLLWMRLGLVSFMILLAVACVAIVFVIFCMPKTKGLTFEEVSNI